MLAYLYAYTIQSNVTKSTPPLGHLLRAFPQDSDNIVTLAPAL